MRRAGLLILSALFSTIALVLAAPAPAATLGSVEHRVERLTGYRTVCTDVVGPHAASGWFDWRESDPPVIELDVGEVCRPIVRLWNLGYPRGDYVREWRLGRAIFVVAHEARHGQQFAGDPNQLVTGDCLGVSCEDDADNYAATRFRRWAYQTHVYRPCRRVRLASLIAPDVGYHPRLAGWAWLG